MKPHPRIRKTIKWGGAAATLVLLGLVVASFSWWAKLSSPLGRTWRFDQGILVADAAPASISVSWVPDGRWRFEVIEQPPPDGNQKVRVLVGGRRFSIWPVILASAVITTLAWRLDTLARRRAALNLCPNCNYNRSGLPPHANCPECNTPPANP